MSRRRPWTMLGLLTALAALAGLAWALQAGPWAGSVAGSAPGSGAGSAPGRAPDAGAPAAPARARAAPGPVPVELGEVRADTLPEVTSAVGSLRAAQQVVLRPEVGGRILALDFREGQPVRRGQRLVQLDDRLQRAELAQAEAQAAVARTLHRRNLELVGEGFVSRSAADQSQAALAVAEAQVALARTQVERMRLNAPFDGVAGLRRVDLGAVVAAGAELLTLESAGPLELAFTLPERASPRLRPGQAVRAWVDARPGAPLEAVVRALAPALDPDGRAVEVRASLARVEPGLKPGMFARVELELGRREGALTVPEEALVPADGQAVVIRAVPGEGGGLRSERVAVRTGWRGEGRVEVIGPLAAGDRIVTAAPARLLRGEGLALEPVQLGASAAAR